MRNTGSNELKIVVERDAHDDTYYKLIQGSFIVAERINDVDDLLLFIKNRLEKMG